MWENRESINTRFAYRFVPISLITKASGNLDEFKRLTNPIIENFMLNQKRRVIEENVKNEVEKSEAHFSWCIEFKNRNNAKIKRPEFIDLLNQMLIDHNPPKIEKTENGLALKEENIDVTWHLDYKYADYDFIIEVFRDIMMFSIVKEYK